MIGEDLPVGAKTADVLRVLRGRVWGEDRRAAQLLYFDMEHGVTDVEVIQANEAYARVAVVNHREGRHLDWLVGRSADREDRIFVHAITGESHSRAEPIEQFVRRLERRNLGFSRRIQGDIMMALGAFVKTYPGHMLGDTPSASEEHRAEWRLTVGEHAGRASLEHRNLVDGRSEPASEPGASFAGHRITCPAGVFGADWNTRGSAIPVAICLGTFDIAHEEHGGVTIEVPRTFVGVLTPQDTGSDGSFRSLFNTAHGTSYD